MKKEDIEVNFFTAKLNLCTYITFYAILFSGALVEILKLNEQYKRWQSYFVVFLLIIYIILIIIRIPFYIIEKKNKIE